MSFDLCQVSTKVELPIPSHLSNCGTDHEQYAAMQIFLL